MSTPITARGLSAVCVFCGSHSGTRPEFRSAAVDLGREMARRGLTLVYGGGHVGLMGAVADAVLQNGGCAIGVMPEALVKREIAHRGLTRLHVVASMHERKALMADLADAFVLLPGGFGSWDEFCEAITWRQLGIHSKPCGILNVLDYYGSLLALTQRAIAEGFVRSDHWQGVVVDDTPAALLSDLEKWGGQSRPQPAF